jgi:hypothetical protein
VRILQISHAFPPTFGGVESHLWDITHGLARRGHDVACLADSYRLRRWPAAFPQLSAIQEGCWEYFLRELDAGGERARRVLYAKLPSTEFKIPRTEAITNYIRLLFAGGSLLLIVVFLSEFHSSITGCLSAILRIAWPSTNEGIHTSLFVIGIWLLVKAWVTERQFNQLVRVIGSAIAES